MLAIDLIGSEGIIATFAASFGARIIVVVIPVNRADRVQVPSRVGAQRSLVVMVAAEFLLLPLFFDFQQQVTLHAAAEPRRTKELRLELVGQLGGVFFAQFRVGVLQALAQVSNKLLHGWRWTGLAVGRWLHGCRLTLMAIGTLGCVLAHQRELCGIAQASSAGRVRSASANQKCAFQNGFLSKSLKPYS